MKRSEVFVGACEPLNTCVIVGSYVLLRQDTNHKQAALVYPPLCVCFLMAVSVCQHVCWYQEKHFAVLTVPMLNSYCQWHMDNLFINVFTTSNYGPAKSTRQTLLPRSFPLQVVFVVFVFASSCYHIVILVRACSRGRSRWSPSVIAYMETTLQ